MSTEDDKELRERLQKEAAEDETLPVPIYGGPIDVPSSEGAIQLLSTSTVDFETQVERDIVSALPCKHCGELPIQADDGEGKVESGCIEGCPHEGAELTPGQWITQNRKDV